MAKNIGKIFEEDFIKSVPNYLFKFRFRDLPYFLTRNCKYEVNNNPADFLIFKDYLFILELKTVGGSSYPFNNTRKNQVEGLMEYSDKDKTICGFVIFMRKFEETYFLDIKDYVYLLKNNNRKSISIDELRFFGKRVFQTKKRTRYCYDVATMLDTIVSGLGIGNN